MCTNQQSGSFISSLNFPLWNKKNIYYVINNIHNIFQSTRQPRTIWPIYFVPFQLYMTRNTLTRRIQMKKLSHTVCLRSRGSKDELFTGSVLYLFFWVIFWRLGTRIMRDVRETREDMQGWWRNYRNINRHEKWGEKA
jgi:hypothetical protein